MGNSHFIEQAITATAEAVEKALDRLLPQPEGLESRLLEAMRYAVFNGGKRLRPFLVVATADLFGVDKTRSLRVAAAIECLHSYSLVHDDLPSMDNDDLRRGKPTTHKQYDEATAILVGDALQSLAFEILASEKTHADPHVRIDLVRALAKAAGPHGMVGGQMIDIEADHMDLDMGGVSRLQQLKTGALICFSAEAGAILGKADDHRRSQLLAYARDLGLAFQIADDLLDHQGDPDVVGKAVGKDAEQGKATFVSLMGAERAQQQANMLADQAVSHLKDFGERAILLQGLAKFVVHRDF